MVTIKFLDESPPESSIVELVGGPRGGERLTLHVGPDRIVLPDGTYRRSVRGADDGALRYVWEPRDAPTATRR